MPQAQVWMDWAEGADMLSQNDILREILESVKRVENIAIEQAKEGREGEAKNDKILAAVIALRAELAAANGKLDAAMKEIAVLRSGEGQGRKDAEVRVSAFKAYRKARKEQAGTREEIARGVLDDFEANGRPVYGPKGRRITVGAFLKEEGAWERMGCPDAEEFERRRREERRAHRGA